MDVLPVWGKVGKIWEAEGGGGSGLLPSSLFLPSSLHKVMMCLESPARRPVLRFSGSPYTFLSSLPLPPPRFYVFLIFKAVVVVVGLSHKILSNQILFSNLEFWLPSGRKSGLGGQGLQQ